jgi:hypothetical protein
MFIVNFLSRITGIINLSYCRSVTSSSLIESSFTLPCALGVVNNPYLSNLLFRVPLQIHYVYSSQGEID